MRESQFPKPIGEVVKVLTELFRHQGKSEAAELLEYAHARFDETNYDNWNGGIYTWALRLEVPVHLYATAKPRLTAIEKEIGEELAALARTHAGHVLDEVTITPVSSASPILGQRMEPSEHEVQGLWTNGCFRLFLSHLSSDKVAVSKVKKELAQYGISSFVAHEDIKPTTEWVAKIELALRSMHALVALISPGFHDSDWTDQEIGWGLGRGVFTISIRLGADPCGLAGKYQGATGSFDNPSAIAYDIVNLLLENPKTHGEMRRALVGALEKSPSYMATGSVCDFICKMEGFSEEEVVKIRSAVKKNRNVSGHFTVPAKIALKFGPEKVEVASSEIPF